MGAPAQDRRILCIATMCLIRALKFDSPAEQKEDVVMEIKIEVDDDSGTLVHHFHGSEQEKRAAVGSAPKQIIRTSEDRERSQLWERRRRATHGRLFEQLDRTINSLMPEELLQCQVRRRTRAPRQPHTSAEVQKEKHRLLEHSRRCSHKELYRELERQVGPLRGRKTQASLLEGAMREARRLAGKAVQLEAEKQDEAKRQEELKRRLGQLRQVTPHQPRQPGQKQERSAVSGGAHLYSGLDRTATLLNEGANATPPDSMEEDDEWPDEESESETIDRHDELRRKLERVEKKVEAVGTVTAHTENSNVAGDCRKRRSWDCASRRQRTDIQQEDKGSSSQSHWNSPVQEVDGGGKVQVASSDDKNGEGGTEERTSINDDFENMIEAKLQDVLVEEAAANARAKEEEENEEDRTDAFLDLLEDLKDEMSKVKGTHQEKLYKRLIMQAIWQEDGCTSTQAFGTQN